jgi:hypothetical protein
MGVCQTSAFTWSPDGSDAPEVPAVPVHTTVPVAGRHYAEEFDWNQLEDLLPPPMPVPPPCSNWPRASLDSNPVHKTRKSKPLHTILPPLDNSWVNAHSYDQIPHTDSFSINQYVNVDYPG